MNIQPAAAEANFRFPDPISFRMIAAISAVLLLLGLSGHRLEIERLFAAPPGQSVGIAGLIGRFFPPQLEERRQVNMIADFDTAQTPLFARIEYETISEDAIDPDTSVVARTRTTRAVLVEPLGYVGRVAVKIWETFEIALWGTLLALLMGFPLAMLGVRSESGIPVAGALCRGVVSALRALTELITALLLVAVYGFGPVAGVLALGLHGAGFIGKFFAEEIENADKAPQHALMATGCSRFAVWRFAVLPQVLPAYIGYALYLLDRNVRMASIVGLVGAGGIGQELKGRFDMYEYPRVGTILIAILIIVILLDGLSAHLRKRWA